MIVGKAHSANQSDPAKKSALAAREAVMIAHLEWDIVV